jgi:hypothetical protein
MMRNKRIVDMKREVAMTTVKKIDNVFIGKVETTW